MQQEVIDDRQPILTMLVNPRETFRYSIEEKSFSLTLYIGAAGGFSNEILNYFQQDYPKNGYLAEIIYNSLIWGIIGYLIVTFILGYLLHLVGKSFGAQSTFKGIFQALCLATIPYIWLLPILLFWMQLSPTTFFEVNVYDLPVAEKIIFIVGSVVGFVAVVWNFILTIIGLSETMQVSKWKAFGLYCLVVVLMLTVLMLIAFII